jgi:hypothetical protein
MTAAHTTMQLSSYELARIACVRMALLRCSLAAQRMAICVQASRRSEAVSELDEGVANEIVDGLVDGERVVAAA